MDTDGYLDPIKPRALYLMGARVFLLFIGTAEAFAELADITSGPTMIFKGITNRDKLHEPRRIVVSYVSNLYCSL